MLLARIELEDGAATIVRPLAEADHAFIFSSWLKSYRGSATDVSSAVYFAQHHRLVDRLLKRSVVLIAANADDLTQILGYLVCEEVAGVAVVHYVYVKAPFRNLGIASHLMRAACGMARGVHHSHATSAGHQLARRFHSVFNPYLAH